MLTRGTVVLYHVFCEAWQLAFIGMTKYLRTVDELRMTLCGGFAALVTCLLRSIERMACMSRGIGYASMSPWRSLAMLRLTVALSSGDEVLAMMMFSRMGPDGKDGNHG